MCFLFRISNFLFQLPEDNRPFLGPLAYVGLPGSFTQFHQDGGGTVDAVHYCHSGANEVVMLNQMSNDEKIYALQLLLDSYHPEAKDLYKKAEDFLYSSPHDVFTVSESEQEIYYLFFLPCLCLTLFVISYQRFAIGQQRRSLSSGKSNGKFFLFLLAMPNGQMFAHILFFQIQTICFCSEARPNPSHWERLPSCFPQAIL